MRILIALAAAAMITATASATDLCGGRYNGYSDWAQQAFCKPQSGG